MTLIQKIEIEKLRTNQLVPYYLMAGWLYNSRDDIIMSDDAWDYVCSRLLKEWNVITHPHKEYIEYTSLETATSQYLVDNKVPMMARSAAAKLLNKPLYLGTLEYAPNKKESVGLENFFE